MGTLRGHTALPAPRAPQHGKGCPPSIKDRWWSLHPCPLATNTIMVISPPSSTSKLLVSSALMNSLTSLNQAFPAVGWVFCHSPNWGARHWTPWKNKSLLGMHEVTASYLSLQKCSKVFYPVKSKSVECTCGMDYTDPFRALNIFK